MFGKPVDIFTDGGCRGNGKENNLGAWAYTFSYNGEIYEDAQATRGTTNNIQEMTACIEAIKKAKRLDINAININSDSAYVVNGMNSWVDGWKSRGWKKSKGEILNLKLWKELDRLNNENMKISWLKVKGHADNEGNNRADELVNISMNEYEKDKKEENS